MIFESIVFMGTAFYIDVQSIALVTPVATVESVSVLDPDVEAERLRTESIPSIVTTSLSVMATVGSVDDLIPYAAAAAMEIPYAVNKFEPVPLKVFQLRKVFPPKQAGRPAVIANENVSFCVEKGEIFGLLGANGK